MQLNHSKWFKCIKWGYQQNVSIILSMCYSWSWYPNWIMKSQSTIACWFGAQQEILLFYLHSCTLISALPCTGCRCFFHAIASGYVQLTYLSVALSWSFYSHEVACYVSCFKTFHKQTVKMWSALLRLPFRKLFSNFFLYKTGCRLWLTEKRSKCWPLCDSSLD